MAHDFMTILIEIYKLMTVYFFNNFENTVQYRRLRQSFSLFIFRDVLYSHYGLVLGDFFT